MITILEVIEIGKKKWKKLLKMQKTILKIC